jgi:hypothetical protein
MPKINFTPNLARHVVCPDADVAGDNVAELLSNYFRDHPAVRDYVVDEHGAVRKHMVIFVDGHPLRDRQTLSDAVAPGSAVFVLQALSGG